MLTGLKTETNVNNNTSQSLPSFSNFVKRNQFAAKIWCIQAK